MGTYHKTHLIFLLVLVLVLAICSSSADGDPSPPTVWEILSKYGLPSGLLPDSVTSYSLSDVDGTFSVELQKPCYIHFDYLVYYDRKITGKLQMGSITNLNGIQVKRFFLWLDVDQIRVDLPPSNNIYFQVGIINKKLNVDQFLTVKSCTQKALVSCAHSHPKFVPELPSALDEIELLITE